MEGLQDFMRGWVKALNPLFLQKSFKKKRGMYFGSTKSKSLNIEYMAPKETSTSPNKEPPTRPKLDSKLDTNSEARNYASLARNIVFQVIIVKGGNKFTTSR